MFRVDVAQPDPRDDRIHIEDVGHKCDGLLPASTREHGTAEHAAPLKDSLEALLHERTGQQDYPHPLVRLKLPPTAAIEPPPPLPCPSRCVISAQNARRSDISIPTKEGTRVRPEHEEISMEKPMAAALVRERCVDPPF